VHIAHHVFFQDDPRSNDGFSQYLISRADPDDDDEMAYAQASRASANRASLHLVFHPNRQPNTTSSFNLHTNTHNMFRTSIIKSARAVAAPRYFSASALRMAEGATGSAASRATGSAGGSV